MDQPGTPRPAQGGRATALALGAMVLVPMLLDLASGGTRAAFRYLAPDSFYYHTVARNIALHGSVSYDGHFATNGFHPLWQATLAALYFLLHHLGCSESSYLWGSVLLSALLVAASFVIVGRAFAACGRRLGPLAFLAPVGLYGILILPAWWLMVDVRGLKLPTQGSFPLFGTAWSFANGMESGLVLLFLALVAREFARNEPLSARRAAVLGSLCAGTVFARLDHVFFALGVGVVLAGRGTGLPGVRRRRPLLWFTICLGGPVLLYLWVNRLYSGVAFPLSGAAKTSFPIPIADNFRNLVAVILHPWRDMLAPSRFYRVTQLLLPSLFAAAHLGRRISRSTERDGLVDYTTALAIGTILLSAYNFFFVPPFSMGHWYSPASIAFVSVAAALREPPFTAPQTSPRVTGWLGTCLVSLLIFSFFQRRTDYHALYADLYLEDAPAARAFYAENPPRLLEYDDGIVSFSTGFPAMSGTGLAADREAAQAIAKGELPKLAWERGFDRVASLVYLPPDAARAGAPAGSLPTMALGILRQNAGALRPHLEFVAPSGRFWIIRMER